MEGHGLELMQRIEELRAKRDEMRKTLEAEEEEKSNIENDIVVLTKRIAHIDDSLSIKYSYAHEYDKTLHEVEAAYSKILESSQALLHVLKTETIQISNRRLSPARDSNKYKKSSQSHHDNLY